MRDAASGRFMSDAGGTGGAANGTSVGLVLVRGRSIR